MIIGDALTQMQRADVWLLHGFLAPRFGKGFFDGEIAFDETLISHRLNLLGIFHFS
jgi:hypothetical protein